MPSAAMGATDGYGPTEPSGASRKIWNDPQPGRPRTGPNGETLGFRDFLDIINPLQHIPIVSTIYRSITGDQINPGPRLIGSTLLGGPVGFAVASANVASEMATGADIGEGLMAQFSGQAEEAAPPPTDPAQPEVVVASAAQPAARGTAPNQAALESGPPMTGPPITSPPITSPPAASPWSIDLTGQGTPSAPLPAPALPSRPVLAPPLPGRRPDSPSPLADPLPKGVSAPTGVHAAVQPRPAPTPVEAAGPRPLVGPRQDPIGTQKAHFLPQPVVPPLAGPAPLSGPAQETPGKVMSPQPGALALTGPLSLPLTPQPAGDDPDAEKRRDQREAAQRDLDAQEQREASLALDRFLRQAAIDSERRAANPAG